ncbi:formylglycine-generating enzyme family protein [Pseudomonas fluorescens]|uniref:formylglycine-generating enzyme family protein n=1 Tax=Pseudomonas fluorescens TaxID=294 RepID=UPI002ACAFCE5|nr:formylglycine-generating enzyme family protein [Pseudomonas fluorescens]MDZ5435200.1 formylglycine-generating enzyme family protein [Pseudomonas fluorescens]
MNYLKSIVFVLILFSATGCEQVPELPNTVLGDSASQELQGFIQNVKSNLIFVEGGKFLMGDYGMLYGPERLPFDFDKDSKPLHEVELSSYSISKYKITNWEYQFYLGSNGQQLRQDAGEKFKFVSKVPNIPAHLDWFEAEQYCSWLARISELPFGLPTEAQWEYAARSRGQFLMVATDDGTYKTNEGDATEFDGPRGINISTTWDRGAFAIEQGWKTEGLTPLPVDRFPPNPLGLYAMSDNGFEWVNDWYDPDYYQRSPVKDPLGPDMPVYKDPSSNDKHAKVLRGQDYANPSWGGGVNVYRSYKNPDGNERSTFNSGDLLVILDKTARCVLNLPRPIR